MHGLPLMLLALKLAQTVVECYTYSKKKKGTCSKECTECYTDLKKKREHAFSVVFLWWSRLIATSSLLSTFHWALVVTPLMGCFMYNYQFALFMQLQCRHPNCIMFTWDVWRVIACIKICICVASCNKWLAKLHSTCQWKKKKKMAVLFPN